MMLLGWRRARHHVRRRQWVALVRSLWISFVLCDDIETCQGCGRRYDRWWAPQPLWDELIGNYGGLLCPRCFTVRAEAVGVRVCWTPMVTSRDGCATTNHWLDETRDALMMGEPDPGYFPDGKVRQPQPTWARVAECYPVDAPSPYPVENRAEVPSGVEQQP